MKEHWEYLVGLAAIIGALWGRIRGLLNMLGNMVVVTVETDTDLTRALLKKLRAKRKFTVDGLYYMDKLPIREAKEHQWVPYKDWKADTALFRYRWGILKFKTEVTKENGSSSTTKYTFSFIRKTVDWVSLVDEAARAYVDDNEGASYSSYRHRIVHHHGAMAMSSAFKRGDDMDEIQQTRSKVRWNSGNMCVLIGRKPIEIGDWGATTKSYVMPKALSQVSHEIATWVGNRDKYEERGLTWKRGLLLKGKPGGGKTSYARAEAIKHDLPVHVMHLASLSNQELERAWREAAANVPCIVLIEDIDRVFDGSENVAVSSRGLADGALTHDTLINTIDGIEQHNGILLIVTTNHLDKVDPALKRAGRLDRIVDFPELEVNDAVAIANNILSNPLVAQRVVKELGPCTANDLQEACCRLFLEELFQQEQDDEDAVKLMSPSTPELIKEVISPTTNGKRD